MFGHLDVSILGDVKIELAVDKGLNLDRDQQLKKLINRRIQIVHKRITYNTGMMHLLMTVICAFLLYKTPRITQMDV